MGNQPSWKITWTTNAEQTFRLAERVQKSRLRAALEEIAGNPTDEENGRIRRLWGELTALYRYQLGKVIIVYRIQEEDQIIRIVAIDFTR